LFNCALELLASVALKSEQELLELVKKAKHDANKYHPHAPIVVKKPSCKYYCLSLLIFSLLFLEFFCVFWAFCGENIVSYKAFKFKIKCVWCLFVFCIGQGVVEVANFQSLGHWSSPKALAANHVNRSSFSISYTCFNYLPLFLVRESWNIWRIKGNRSRSCCM
jgi:hypothetical protein